MSPVGDVEAVRGLAARCRAAADRVETIVVMARSDLDAVLWVGPSAEEMRQRAASRVGAGLAVADEFRSLAIALDRHADRFVGGTDG